MIASMITGISQPLSSKEAGVSGYPQGRGDSKGFMTLSRQFSNTEAGAWYITALYVRHNYQADQCELAMTELF